MSTLAPSPERELLVGLRDLCAPAVDPIPGYPLALPYEVDRAFALNYTNVATDPFGRWAQGILMLQSRGAPGVPLDADDIAATLVKVLTRTDGVSFGTVTVTQCLAGPSSRGLDSSKRSVRADRLDLYLDYPQ